MKFKLRKRDRKLIAKLIAYDCDQAVSVGDWIEKSFNKYYPHTRVDGDCEFMCHAVSEWFGENSYQEECVHEFINALVYPYGCLSDYIKEKHDYGNHEVYVDCIMPWWRELVAELRGDK